RSADRMKKSLTWLPIHLVNSPTRRTSAMDTIRSDRSQTLRFAPALTVGLAAVVLASFAVIALGSGRGGSDAGVVIPPPSAAPTVAPVAPSPSPVPTAEPSNA